MTQTDNNVSATFNFSTECLGLQMAFRICEGPYKYCQKQELFSSSCYARCHATNDPPAKALKGPVVTKLLQDSLVIGPCKDRIVQRKHSKDYLYLAPQTGSVSHP